jgi:hypothetical protein
MTEILRSLSVVIETQTVALSSDREASENIEETLVQARELTLGPNKVEVEILLVTDAALCSVPRGTRNVVIPRARYYALKNGGFAAARGDVVLFNDADTRIAPGYLAALRRAVDNFTDDWAFAGRSVYGGASALARLNTTFSFGHLHSAQEHDFGNRSVMSHNVAIRRAQAPLQPFGPGEGRVGGDDYLTRWYRQQRHPVRFVPEMVISHHDISTSLPLIMERHLRDLMWNIRSERELLLWSKTGLKALAWAGMSPLWRGRQLLRHGPGVGLRVSDYALAALILPAYASLDVMAMLAVEALPQARRAWLDYQNGPN